MSKPAAVLDVNTGESWIGRAVMFGLGLLFAVTLAFAVFDYVVPRGPEGVQSAARRFGWYLRSGQWYADVRTLAAALQFLVDGDPPAPTPTMPANWPVAPISPIATNRPAQRADGMPGNEHPAQLWPQTSGIGGLWRIRTLTSAPTVASSGTSAAR